MYSVIIPTFNRKQLLSAAIESVLQQQCTALELIVVDDGSGDGTGAMIARHYPQVRYFYQANQGPAAARNHGIREARGEFIAMLDSDDLWLAHKISLETALFERFPQADMLAGNACAFIEGRLHAEDTFAQRNISFFQQQPRFFDWSLDIMKQGPVCCTSSMTFKKSALLKMGAQPFDESLRLDEDWDFEFRFFSQFKALLYPQTVCHSRVFYDGTRRFYSPAGVQKSRDEQTKIWQQQRHIIARYLNNPHWCAETEQGFRHRHQQLGTLLAQNP